MQSVLISIRPEWVEKIARGEKTVEVRKTRPKIETPFKCYIYCTKNDNRKSNILFENGALSIPRLSISDKFSPKLELGKVIGEFVCDSIHKMAFKGTVTQDFFKFTKGTCLTDEELTEYADGKWVYFWHISNLVVYDKPRELSEFKTPCKTCWFDANGCENCTEYVLKMPPQSWCYVEELT